MVCYGTNKDRDRAAISTPGFRQDSLCFHLMFACACLHAACDARCWRSQK